MFRIFRRWRLSRCNRLAESAYAVGDMDRFTTYRARAALPYRKDKTMTETKPFWRSMTLQGVGVMLIAVAPEIVATAMDMSDPLWGMLEGAGISAEVVSLLRLGALVLGSALAAWGRFRATTKVTAL